MEAGIGTIEREVIENKYSQLVVGDADEGNRKQHGKLVKIIRKTNSIYMICIFENGNEFVVKAAMKKYTEKYRSKLIQEQDNVLRLTSELAKANAAQLERIKILGKC